MTSTIVIIDHMQIELKICLQLYMIFYRINAHKSGERNLLFTYMQSFAVSV